MPTRRSIALPPKPKFPTMPAPATGSDADIAFVEKIAKLLESANVAEIEVERGGFKVRVSRHGGGGGAQMVYAPAPMAAPAAAPAPLPRTLAPAADAPADLAKHPGAVASPMVGTAYLSPQPGAAVFVQVGDTVKEDQTLLIIEAMKTMNPIPSPKAGRVTKILVQDARPVEYGEILMIIE